MPLEGAETLADDDKFAWTLAVRFATTGLFL
jgi:hypothetical protein